MHKNDLNSEKCSVVRAYLHTAVSQYTLHGSTAVSYKLHLLQQLLLPLLECRSFFCLCKCCTCC